MAFCDIMAFWRLHILNILVTDVMEVDIDAVYVRDSDFNLRGNTLLSLCYAANEQFPGEILGAQLVNNVWSVYARSMNTRAALINSGLDINGSNIRVFDDKPFFDGGKKTERVVIKDLPATLPPDRILAFLRGLPHVTTRSRVMYAKERLGGEELSPFINGDRIVYVNADVNPPLPKETVISGHHCRIWHPSQKNFCKRCSSHGHRTIDTDLCESYEPDCLVSAWRSDNNPLSNFYRCTITHGGIQYKSSEHFYQHEYCLFMKKPDVAELVVDAPTPKEAKQIASQLKGTEYSELLAEWHKINLSVMNYILRVKWNFCKKFRQSLLSTEGMVVAEATSDDFWGVGVAPNLAQHTKPTKFLGQNHMGKLQMALRCHVAQPGVLNDDGEIALPLKPEYTSDSTANPDGSLSAILESLTMPPVLIEQGQGDSSENKAGPSDSSPAHLLTHPDTLSSITDDVNETRDNTTPPSTTDDGMECEASDPQPTTSTSDDIPPPKAPPRKKLLRGGKSSTFKTVKSSLNTLDNFVNKESPSCKRKPSGDAGSPSSIQNMKSSRTDGADSVS